MKTPERQDPDGVITIPFEDFDVLVRFLQSHLHRDTSVRYLLSGLEPHWICEQSSVLIREIAVDRDEQLGIILDWIRDGGG